MKQNRLVFAVCLAAAVTLALTAAPNARAQKRGAAGVLTGVVLGPDDKPVPHASITYQSAAGIAPHAVHADATGHFTISKLRTDNYDLRATGRGVYSEWEKNVAVRSGYTKTVTLRLIYAKQIPKAYTKSKPAQQ
jgi:Carboxypeptidase regulatory-like domain